MAFIDYVDLKSYMQSQGQLPVYIILQYSNNTLKFPVNPESIKIEIPSESSVYTIEEIGEIAIPTNKKLSSISISSVFWQDKNYIPSYQYVNWIKTWQDSKKPANLIITRFNYSMEVICNNFSHWINAGEENDIYFNLDLIEYKAYGARLSREIKSKSLIQKVKDANKLVSSPILIEIPITSRSRISRAIFKNRYAIKTNETLISITKKITGSSDKWQELYEVNKDKFDSDLNLIENAVIINPWAE